MRDIKLAILQPHIPHYRADFFRGITDVATGVDIYCYNKRSTESSGFSASKEIKIQNLFSVSFGPLLVYNPFTLIAKNYDVIVLMLHIGHISTWLLLFTRFLHRREIILWGHGISVRRYLKEEKKPSFLIKLMISLADTVWLYTPKEVSMWKKIFPSKNIVSLNNTITGIEQILATSKSPKLVRALKSKHRISHQLTFIYCARFTKHRRIDLMLNFIENTLDKDYGFIIIGDGTEKPDFTKYVNVYDYGRVYDYNLKQELFTIADFYFQPAWVGLSIVEAMAYSKPTITFNRAVSTLQCVEYAYLNPKNSIIIDSVEDLIKKMDVVNKTEISSLSIEARKQAMTLTMKNMVSNAINSLTVYSTH